MEEQTRIALLTELDEGIARAEAEANKSLREFREWIISQSTNGTPQRRVATIGARRVRKAKPTTFYLDQAFDHLNGDQELVKISELVDEAVAAGWSSTSENKPVIVRNRLVKAVEDGAVEKIGPRYRRLRPLYGTVIRHESA